MDWADRLTPSEYRDLMRARAADLGNKQFRYPVITNETIRRVFEGQIAGEKFSSSKLQSACAGDDVISVGLKAICKLRASKVVEITIRLAVAEWVEIAFLAKGLPDALDVRCDCHNNQHANNQILHKILPFPASKHTGHALSRPEVRA